MPLSGTTHSTQRPNKHCLSKTDGGPQNGPCSPPPSERKDWRCCLRGIWSRRTARLVPLSGCALSLLKTSSGLHFHQRICPFQRGRSGPLLGPIRTHSFGPALGTSAHDPTSYFPAPQATHFLSLGNLVQRPRKEEESKRLHVRPWETPACK